FVVDGLERCTRLAQRLLGAHALLQRGLALGLERLDRAVALRELRREFAQTAVDLAALSAHALQRLRQRGGLRALGLDGQRQRMRGFGGSACGLAGSIAGLAQACALGIQRRACVLELGHARHRLVQPRARLARLRAAGLERLGELRGVGVDLLDPPARRLQPALLALQLAGELRHATVRQVQRALRVLALLFGDQRAVAPRRQSALEFLLAVLELLDLAAQRLDLALAQQRALLGRAKIGRASCRERVKTEARGATVS